VRFVSRLAARCIAASPFVELGQSSVVKPADPPDVVRLAFLLCKVSGFG
jgi:hypothetical protein